MQQQNFSKKLTKRPLTSQGKATKRKKNFRKNTERNNFQDAFSDREFNKGYEEGKLTKSLRKNNGMNDISWYNKNPQLIKDTCSFPFGFPAGMRFPMDSITKRENFPSTIGSNVQLNYCAPSLALSGIMTLGIAPTIGISVDSSSPINIASLNNYDTVRKANSGAKNYDNPDLTLYYIAMDSIYMYWNWLQRLYGLIWYVDPQNRYTPRAMIECQGVDFDDLTASIADFRAYINKRAIDMRAFCVPSTFTYFLRHSWLMTNVYYDADNQKAQMYMFVPSWVYKYSEMSSTTGGELLPIKILQGVTYDFKTAVPNKRLKVADLKNILDTMITAALQSQDIGTMSGDVAKAYGNSLFTLSTMPEDYVVQPAYNREVLMQIENASVIPVDTEFTEQNYKIAQDPNTNQLVWNPVVSASEAYGEDGALINMHTQDPTAEDVMIATRLHATLKKRADGKFVFSAVGSEFVTGVYIHLMGPEQGATQPADIPWLMSWFEPSKIADSFKLRLRSIYLNPFQFITTSEVGQQRKVEISTTTAIDMMSILSHFDWHPLIRFFIRSIPLSDGTVYVSPISLIGDLEKYAVIEYFNLQNIHLIALMSMLDV